MDTVTVAQKWSRRWLGWPLPRLGRRRAFSLVGMGRQLLREEGPRAGMWRRHGGGGAAGGTTPHPRSPAVSWEPTPDTPDTCIGCPAGLEGSRSGQGVPAGLCPCAVPAGSTRDVPPPQRPAPPELSHRRASWKHQHPPEGQSPSPEFHSPSLSFTPPAPGQGLSPLTFLLKPCLSPYGKFSRKHLMGLLCPQPALRATDAPKPTPASLDLSNHRAVPLGVLGRQCAWGWDCRWQAGPDPGTHPQGLAPSLGLKVGTRLRLVGD